MSTTSRNLSLYQHTSHLAYCELPSATGTLAQPEDLDEEASKEETAREFVRFELALAAITGANDQLFDYALTQENLDQDEGENRTHASPELTKIYNKESTPKYRMPEKQNHPKIKF
ncbi:hypothetical protein ACHAPJ_008271 [Fusarium lateritium]